ncbi:MAG: ABC transporter permease [Spirochaetes bacterium]|nr:MAG: ABC transporter permease [Spirochaetota bacterium]
MLKYLSKFLWLGAIVGILLLIIIFGVASGGRWLNVLNLQVVTRTAAQLGIVAIGQTLVLITGRFDLSVGSIFGVCGVVFVPLVAAFGIWPGFILALLCGGAIGLLNGTLTEKLRVPSLIATLGNLWIFRGLVFYITGGFANAIPRDLRDHYLITILGGKFAGGWNNLIFWWIIITAVMILVLNRTKFGNAAFAVGTDERSALSRGVSPATVRMAAFIICGFLAAFSGIGTVADMKTGSTTLGQSMELESIAGSVIGGTSLLGGVGSIFGAGLGALLLSFIRSGLILAGAPPYWFVSFVGVVLIGAVLFNTKMREHILKRIERSAL